MVPYIQVVRILTILLEGDFRGALWIAVGQSHFDARNLWSALIICRGEREWQTIGHMKVHTYVMYKQTHTESPASLVYIYGKTDLKTRDGKTEKIRQKR